MKIKLNIIDLFQKSVTNEDYKKLWESNALGLNFFFSIGDYRVLRRLCKLGAFRSVEDKPINFLLFGCKLYIFMLSLFLITFVKTGMRCEKGKL
jgi:hypothetical protein